jgi:hypothetical protein
LAWRWSKEPLDGNVTAARLGHGAAIQLGKGQARTYVLRDQKTGDPVEVGVALTEGAFQGLPETASLGTLRPGRVLHGLLSGELRSLGR